jgi:hypothetical protein
MKERLSAVQRTLLVLLLGAVLLGVIARPAPANGRLLAALNEIESFRSNFERSALERSLIEYAATQARQPLTAVQHASASKLALTNDPPPLQPLAAVSLATLADVRHFAEPHSTLPIGVADATAIGRALTWRLRIEATPPAYTLQSVDIAPGDVTQADLDLEPDVAKLQLAARDAELAVKDASKKVEAAELLLEQRKKWKLPWKVILKTDDARKQAHAALDEKETSLKDLAQRYQQAAARAQRARTTATYPPLRPFGVARVQLLAGDQPKTLQIPVKIEQREVAVPSLRGGEFAAIHAAGLWPEVQSLDPARASAAIRAHFNWHYSYVEPLGFKLGGMTVLQLLPCALPPLLLLLLMRMRAAARSYNPFGTKVRGAMPRVGFWNRPLDAVIVIVLPVLAAISAASSLVLVGQVPALPVLNAVVCLLLGGYAFMKLGELQTLIEEVIRSHSNPPPEGDT